VREFGWDHRNRLIAVTDWTADPSKEPAARKTQTVKFTYDGLDRRISKAVDTTPDDAVDAAILHFINNREDVLLDYLDADGSGPGAPTLSQRYLHGPGIDQVLAQDNGLGTVHWMLTDHLGTVKYLVYQAGQVENHVVYDSFGNVVAQSSTAIVSRYGFTGREWDDETNLQYSRARYFNHSTGLFLSEESIAFIEVLGDPHLYQYVENEPTSFVDATGKNPIWVGVGIAYWIYDTLTNPDVAYAPDINDATPPYSTYQQTAENAFAFACLGHYLNRPYWKYTNPNTIDRTGPYLTRDWKYGPPYGKDFARPKDKLQLPKMPNDVVKVPRDWSRPLSGPQPAIKHPKWGTGGGPEYFKGPKFPD